MESLIARDAGRGSLVAAVILTIALRVGLCLYLDGYVPGGDPAVNVDLVRSVLRGAGLVADTSTYGHAVRAMYPPAYPLLLAGFAAVLGLNTATITILNTVIDLAVAGSIVQLGRKARQPGARLAAAAYLLWPTLILSAPVAQKEGLVTFFAMQLMLAFATLWRRDPRMDAGLDWKWILWVGASAGLLALAQPASIVLPACLGLVMLGKVGFRRLLRTGIPAATITVVVLVPWWIRNWLLFHEFVPLTTTSGHSLMVVLNDGFRSPPPEIARLAEPERATAMGKIALRRIAGQPLAYLKAVARDVIAAWGKGSFAHERLLEYVPTVRLPWALINAAQLAFTAWAAWLRPNRLLLVLLAGSLLSMLLFGIWFEYSERHRQFVLPLLWLLAAPLMLEIGSLRPERGREGPRPLSARQ